MPKLIDITGKTFGRLRVKKYAGKNAARNSMWQCVCRCGTTRIVAGPNLKNGHTKSCGCWSREQARNRLTIHGKYGIKEYQAYRNMLNRCYNINSKDYKNYGGRGITVDPRWRHSFENFFADMGECPLGKTLDRWPDKNGNYSPLNCKWRSRRQQNNNKRTNIEATINGRTRTLAQWCRRLNADYSQVRRYMKKYNVSAKTVLQRFRQ